MPRYLLTIDRSVQACYVGRLLGCVVPDQSALPRSGPCGGQSVL